MPGFKKRRSYKPKSSKKKFARGGRKSSAVSSAVKTYVKSRIHAEIENKCVQINAGNSFGNVNESTDFNAYPMCPLAGYWTVGQGVGQGARVGNIIKTRKVYLNYVLRPTAYDAVFNPSPRPCEIQLMLGYVKNTPCFAPVPGDVNTLNYVKFKIIIRKKIICYITTSTGCLRVTDFVTPPFFNRPIISINNIVNVT